jgi:putative acetyltransferase
LTSQIRAMQAEEARRFLEVHHASVRDLAANDYQPEVISDWAATFVDDGAVERFLLNPDDEIRLVAEQNGKIAGIGALVLETHELRACYVMPCAARQGVGSALVRAIERLARDHGLSHLQLDASINAEPFYRSLGYTAISRGEHIRRSGVRMACIKMTKPLA